MKTHINNEGYRVFNDSGKLVHRWVAEKRYGKEHIDGKEIHHLDKDKLNNDSSNLIVLSKEDHFNLHKYENKRALLTDLIIIFSIIAIIISILSLLIPSILENRKAILFSLGFFIFLASSELKWNWISKAFTNPYDPLIKDKSSKD